MRSHGKRKRELQENDKEATHIYGEMSYLIAMLMFLGEWPVRQTKKGFQSTPWISGPMLWSYIQVTFEMVSIAACLRHSMGQLLAVEPLPFVERVIVVLHIFYETVPVVVPFVHWHTGHRLANYFNEWSRLQSTWVAVTGSPLRADSCRYVRWVGPAIFVWSIVTPLYHARFVPDMFPWKLPLYSLVVMHLLTQSTLWGALNREVAGASDKLRAHLRQSLRSGRPDAGPGAVRGSCLLWLRLRSITTGLGSAWGSVMLHIMLVSMLMGLTACFGLLAAVRMRVVRRCLSTAITILLAIVINTSTCASVERAVNKVSKDLINEIFSTPLYALPAETADEMMRFASVIQFKPIRFTLNGFVVVDGRLAVSIASTVTTYIVVLAQLAIALQAEDDRKNI